MMNKTEDQSDCFQCIIDDGGSNKKQVLVEKAVRCRCWRKQHVAGVEILRIQICLTSLFNITSLNYSLLTTALSLTIFCVFEERFLYC